MVVLRVPDHLTQANIDHSFMSGSFSQISGNAISFSTRCWSSNHPSSGASIIAFGYIRDRSIIEIDDARRNHLAQASIDLATGREHHHRLAQSDVDHSLQGGILDVRNVFVVLGKRHIVPKPHPVFFRCSRRLVVAGDADRMLQAMEGVVL